MDNSNFGHTENHRDSQRRSSKLSLCSSVNLCGSVRNKILARKLAYTGDTEIAPTKFTVSGSVRKNIRWGLITIAILLLISCSSTNKLANMPSTQKWENAERHFNRRKYNKAIPFYQQLIFERSSIYTADAQYKLGECYFLTKKYIEAIFEYQELLRLFPDHHLARDAQFRIGEAYVKISMPPEFTQEESNRAIDSFMRFIEKYPDDSRVPEANEHIIAMQKKNIEKRYRAGYIYFKTKDYPASQLYLNEIIAIGARDTLERKSLYYTALIHIDRREETEARDTIKMLESRFPDSKELKTAKKRFDRMNSTFWRVVYFY